MKITGKLNTSTRWWAKFPLDAYAMNFDFEHPVSRPVAVAYIKGWHFGLRDSSKQRLPHGTEIWMG
jgi:hypothetical protein